MCKVFLLMGGLLFAMSSCETEIIPDDPEGGNTTVSGKERNFSLTLRFADFGEADTLSATHSMEPETDVIRVKDDLYIYATLAVDTAVKTPAVTTRAFQDGARIHIVAYEVASGPNYTQVFDEIYDVQPASALRRESSTDLINLHAGKYKLVAYSYNNTTVAPPAYTDTIKAIDPVNDLIWGESDTITVYDGGITYIPIKMYHKLSQVKLVATTGPGGPLITAFDGVTLPGYTVNLTTLNGTLAKNTAISQSFTFPTLNAATVNADTRTVYTGTPGDIPTIFHINSLTAINTTLTDVWATFAKSLKSGYSYTMTMKIGTSPDLTDNIPADFTPYVGAFWKAGQTGERLIRLPRMANGTIDSVWTAQVIEGRDWILLDTLMTADPNVGWRTGANELSVDDANDPNFESNPARQLSVQTASTFVSGMVKASGGNNQIYFRIGLKNKYTPTPEKPARYGIVLLTYGNNKYRNRIWIRQGEGDDYLMRKNDDVNSGGFVGSGANARPSAVRFSPYNLTADVLNAPVRNTYAIRPASDPVAKFTNYPTQAGAFFQWASNSFERFAWDAYIPGVPSGTTSTSWDNVPKGNNDYWKGGTSNNLYLNHETCPSGYRRPTDGATDALTGIISTGLSQTNTNVLNSEFRQSLYLYPQSGISPMTNTDIKNNTVWGYYADGFFDRRQITGGPGASASIITPNSTVAASLPTIANVGRLFYNINNNASIFFPASGNRNYELYGALYGIGDYGIYWSSSAVQDNTGWGLAFISSSTYQNEFERSYGYNIRCVKDEFTPSPTLSVDPTNIYFAYDNDGSNPAYKQTVYVITNQPSWSTSGNPGWLTITPASGTGTSFTVSPNSVTNVTRTATITVSAGTATPVTINVIQYGDAGGGAEIIYYDPFTRTLKVGRWGYEITDIKQVTLFRFGSVIGLDNSTAIATPSAPAAPATLPANAIKFNPTTTVTSIQVIQNGPVGVGAPNYFSSHGLGNAWNTTIANSPKVSDDAYHTLVNVKAGKGDPCRLIGMTPEQIQGFTTDAQLYAAEQGWRTPSAEENAKYMKGPNPNWSSWTATGAVSYRYDQNVTTGNIAIANFYVNSNGSPGNANNYYSNPNTFWTPVIQGPNPNSANGERHPTPGFRHDSGNGTPTAVGQVGDFWSSTPYSGTGGNITAYAALITPNYIYPAGAHEATFYGSVRCVRKW